MRLRARYYDGRSARAHEVDLLAIRGQVCVRGDDWERIEPLEAIRIGEKLGSAARRIDFADGAQLEVSDTAGFAQWLSDVGYRERHVDLMQRSWTLALVSMVVVVLVGIAAYRWGLPLAAAYAAERVPESVNRELTRGTMVLLERHLLTPSRLSDARQQDLSRGFDAINSRNVGRLIFRSAPRAGPNAMALPDGTIILLDELVEIASDDEQVLAVLAHELAHVEQRHGVRLMIEGAAVAAFFAWWVGDFSPLIAGAPVALLQARHSRELEAEADAVAAYRLRGMGVDPAKLADILERIERAHRGDTISPKRNEADGSAASDGEGWLEYLSSHPATEQRLRALRAPEAGATAPE